MINIEMKGGFAALTLLAGVLLGSGVLALTQAPLDEPKLEIEGLNGSKRERSIKAFELQSMDASAARLLFPSAVFRAPGAHVFELELWSGDRIRGKVIDGGEEHLRLGMIGGASVGFPIESFRSISATVELERSGQLNAPEAGDRLWRRVGSGFDRIDGLLVGFGKLGLVFEGQLGEREYPWSEVAVLWIEELGSAPEEAASQGERVVVDLVDGSRLRGSFQGIVTGHLTVETVAGDEVVLPLETLLEVALDDRRLQFVSAMPFRSVGPTGLFGDEFGMRFEARRDVAVLGGPLVVDGRRHARGIGVHAPSRLHLDWTAGGTLRGAVALDDSARRTVTGGSVIFRVYSDGELLFASKELTPLDGLIELPAIDLSGKRSIELEVDGASDSVMGDRADWLDLRITKQ